MRYLLAAAIELFLWVDERRALKQRAHRFDDAALATERGDDRG